MDRSFFYSLIDQCLTDFPIIGLMSNTFRSIQEAGIIGYGAARPTAVTCYNDLVAIGVCRALHELGLRIPDDVSVIGFDDIPLLEYLPVPLTTVRMPKAAMGEVAAQMLIRHIESRTAVPPQKVVLEAELVVRQSTRALDGAAITLPSTREKRLPSRAAGSGRPARR